MDLTHYVERLRTDLSGTAAVAGPEAQGIAERLLLALDPATRMVMLEALSAAAAEITGELDSDAVEVRMSGRDPEFVVTHLGDAAPPAPPTPPTPPTPPLPPGAEGDLGEEGQSRITLRLPESVKVRAEDAAAEVGQSLNAWLVDAVRAVLDGGRVDLRLGRGSITVTGGMPGGPGSTSSSGRSGRRRRVQGWVT